jgi:hypothetical protein
MYVCLYACVYIRIICSHTVCKYLEGDYNLGNCNTVVTMVSSRERHDSTYVQWNLCNMAPINLGIKDSAGLVGCWIIRTYVHIGESV